MTGKVSLAKIKLDGRYFIITEMSVLKRRTEEVFEMIKADQNVKRSLENGLIILNSTSGFSADLKKLLVKFADGERMRAYKGDFGSYYITDYKKAFEMYDMLDAKAQ